MMPRICGPATRPFAAEAAAKERAADMDFLRCDPEQARDAPLRHRMPWLGVSMDSLSPSQAATMACGSIGLWYWAGVS